MKVAVLMHGLVGNTDKYGTGKIIDPKISHDFFKDRILNSGKPKWPGWRN